MTTTSEGQSTFWPPEAQQFKELMRTLWGEVAAGWRRRATEIEPIEQSVTEKLITMARIGPGAHVLDIGTGIGQPALTVARRVGDQGRVLATDIAPAMLDVARDRATEEGLGNIEFLQADGEELDPSIGPFDAVVSRWVVPLFVDPVGSLGRVRELLAPGGRFAAAVWAGADRVPIIGLLMGTASEVLELPPRPPDAPGALRFAAPGALESAMEQAGFTDVTRHPVIVPFEFASADEFVGYVKDVFPVNAYLADQPPERCDAYWARLAERALAHTEDGGRIELHSESPCVAGTA